VKVKFLLVVSVLGVIEMAVFLAIGCGGGGGGGRQESRIR
jgi:hypothetical protein